MILINECEICGRRMRWTIDTEEKTVKVRKVER